MEIFRESNEILGFVSDGSSLELLSDSGFFCNLFPGTEFLLGNVTILVADSFDLLYIHLLTFSSAIFFFKT